MVKRHFLLVGIFFAAASLPSSEEPIFDLPLDNSAQIPLLKPFSLKSFPSEKRMLTFRYQLSSEGDLNPRGMFETQNKRLMTLDCNQLRRGLSIVVMSAIQVKEPNEKHKLEHLQSDIQKGLDKLHCLRKTT
ncbi:MAG: hypothetical protein H6864_02340 [Micavibrio sp.]|nr:hypothetical protein [Micavibrio sp.]